MTETYRQRLGTTATGGYVVVDVTLGATEGTHQTVAHESITAPVRLSITGEAYEKHERRGDPSRAGQCADALDEITEPAPGWTLDEIRELRALWDRWHLNDLRAACAHMPADARERWDRRERVECSEGSGYLFGTAWLVEPLPDEVVTRVLDLMRDRSDDLYRARGYDASGKPVQS